MATSASVIGSRSTVKTPKAKRFSPTRRTRAAGVTTGPSLGGGAEDLLEGAGRRRRGSRRRAGAGAEAALGRPRRRRRRRRSRRASAAASEQRQQCCSRCSAHPASGHPSGRPREAPASRRRGDARGGEGGIGHRRIERHRAGDRAGAGRGRLRDHGLGAAAGEARRRPAKELRGEGLDVLDVPAQHDRGGGPGEAGRGAQGAVRAPRRAGQQRRGRDRRGDARADDQEGGHAARTSTCGR